MNAHGVHSYCPDCGKEVYPASEPCKYCTAIHEAAVEVVQYVENAMGDFGEVTAEDLSRMGNVYAKKVREMKAEGMKINIIRECIADLMYEDKDILHDLAGDRIFDHASELGRTFKMDRKECRKAIILRIKKNRQGFHKPMVEAMDMLLALEK